MRMKKVSVLVLGFVLLLVILLSYTVFSATTGTFTVGNEAPSLSGFSVQDGASSWDSTTLDTHDFSPSLRWVVNDPNPDDLYSSISIGTTPGGVDIIDNYDFSGASFTQGETITYDYTMGMITIDQTDCVAGSCSIDYYFTITVNDGSLITSEEYVITFLNSVPDTPSGLAPAETHEQAPVLSWIATDADDGSVDKWPADTLTYYITVGDIYGGIDYLDDTPASPSSTIATPIGWEIPDATEARTTVYAQIFTVDNLDIESVYYEDTIDLVDNMPVFEDVYLADEAIDILTDSCTEFPAQNCYLSPTQGDYSSVYLRLSISDADGDCSAVDHTANAVLCLVDAAGAEVCDDITNADYVYSLTYEIGDGTDCDFSVAIPDGSPSGIEFFTSPGIYKIYLDASSQAGMSTDVWNYEWEYVDSGGVFDYPTAVFLGDRAVDGGDGIQLGSWNPGLSLNTMVNYGNVAFNIEWDATDPSSDGLPCSVRTDTCWALETDPGLQIDDDSDQVDDTGNLVAVNVPETPTRIAFEPVGGLEVCDAMDCNNVLLDETLDTYFHIEPPTGLLPGGYETTFVVTTTPI